MTATETTLVKKERTQHAIEQAAYELFMEQGFNATTIRQIAERAGLALGGFYLSELSSSQGFFLLWLVRRTLKA